MSQSERTFSVTPRRSARSWAGDGRNADRGPSMPAARKVQSPGGYRLRRPGAHSEDRPGRYYGEHRATRTAMPPTFISCSAGSTCAGSTGRIRQGNRCHRNATSGFPVGDVDRPTQGDEPWPGSLR